MTTQQLLKHAFIKNGLSYSKLAMKIGVSEGYIAYIVMRMEPENKHLLPETSRSFLVQKAIEELVSPIRKLFKGNS